MMKSGFQRVRLIESDGSMIGVVPIAEARKRAEDQDLDLVLIAAQADNPVCKIMDYGKYMFELAKKEREAKKNQRVTEVKEVGLKLTTEEHDFRTRPRMPAVSCRKATGSKSSSSSAAAKWPIPAGDMKS